LAALAGCAASGGPAKAPATSAKPILQPVALAAANGDMRKYVGTWTSNCGKEFRVNPDGSGGLTSGINTFSLKSVEGNTVRGTLTVDTYKTSDCSGERARLAADIALTYAETIPVSSSYGEDRLFTGSADKLVATMTDAGGNGGNNVFNVGFLDGFTRFQVAPIDHFSTGNLVYSRQ
jgi:hypothetical protein